MFLTFNVLLISTIFIRITHPLTLGLILVIQTILIASYIGLMSQTFWFSYILFLVIVGGILILFIYVISITYNKIFNLKPNLIKLTTYAFIFIFLLIINKFNTPLFINNIETSYINFLPLESSQNLTKLYNFPINLINLFIVNYLFFINCCSKNY